MEKFILDENSNNYRRMKKALWGDASGKIKTFAIISVENPLGWKNSTEEEFIKKYKEWTNNPSNYNKLKTGEMKAELAAKNIEKNGDTVMKFGGFNYVNIKGTYAGNKEKTFFIFNIPFEDAKAIARGYGQESFFYGKVYADHSDIAYYETSDACKTYKLIEITNSVVELKDADDFFSKYGFQYRIDLSYFGADVTPIENNGEFEESMDDKRTFLSRASHRYKSYHK